jgi:hypothetical protein
MQFMNTCMARATHLHNIFTADRKLPRMYIPICQLTRVGKKYPQVIPNCPLTVTPELLKEYHIHKVSHNPNTD